jgi:addiction module HigA family antidote
MPTMRDRRRAPTHPGEILREDVLPALKMTQTEFAERLGVSRLTVSELLHARRSLTPDMSARIAKLLRGSAEFWLRMQAARDLWEIDQDAGRLADIRPIEKRVLEAA